MCCRNDGFLFTDQHICRAVGVRHPEGRGSFHALILGQKSLYVLGVPALRLVKTRVLPHTLDGAFAVDADHDFGDAGNLALRLSPGKTQHIHRVKGRVARYLCLKWSVGRCREVIYNSLDDFAALRSRSDLQQRICPDVINQAVVGIDLEILGQPARTVSGVESGVSRDVIRDFGGIAPGRRYIHHGTVCKRDDHEGTAPVDLAHTAKDCRHLSDQVTIGLLLFKIRPREPPCPVRHSRHRFLGNAKRNVARLAGVLEPLVGRAHGAAAFHVFVEFQHEVIGFQLKDCECPGRL